MRCRECNECCPPDYRNQDTVIKKENILHCMMIHVFFTALAPAMSVQIFFLTVNVFIFMLICHLMLQSD